MSDGNPYYGSGGGGGGFMAGGSPYGSQQSPGGDGRKGRNQSLRPVTVKQILNASQVHKESDFVIDGADIGPVQFVGSVHNQSQAATNVSYEIGDGTGYIDVRQWLDSSDDDAGKTEGIKQDMYVSVIGTIKEFGGKRHISAQHIRAIENPDEVYHHLLKALQISLALRNPGAANGGAGAGAGATHSDYAAGATSGGDMAGLYDSLPPLQRKIMEIIYACKNQEGVHVQSLGGMLDAADGDEVMDALESLMSEGIIYSTCDDLHVTATALNHNNN